LIKWPDCFDRRLALPVCYRVVSFTIQTDSRPTGLIIRIAGEAGMDNVEKLEGELKKISTSRPKLVVFDLSSLDFIASLGMGALMAFRQGVVRDGGMVRVAAAQPAVLDSFKRACLNALFNTCNSVDEALTATKW
jgi:anti-sigma B factor antagonist